MKPHLHTVRAPITLNECYRPTSSGYSKNLPGDDSIIIPIEADEDTVQHLSFVRIVLGFCQNFVFLLMPEFCSCQNSKPRTFWTSAFMHSEMKTEFWHCLGQ